MNRFVKGNPLLCIGCRTCMVACVVAHRGNGIFTTDPDSEDFFPRIHVIKTKTKTMTVQCHHCENAPCVTVCPVGALENGPDSILLHEERCIGCQQCTMACPFGAIQMKTVDDEQGVRTVANKCDLCAHTEEGTPACVSHCPTEALTYYVDDAIQNIVSQKNLQTARKAWAAKEGQV